MSTVVHRSALWLTSLTIVFLAALLATRTAQAQSCTINWNSDSNGNWDTASNWDQNRVPNASDDVCINRPVANPEVTMPTGVTVTVRSLTNLDGTLYVRGNLALGSGQSKFAAVTYLYQCDAFSGRVSVASGGSLTLAGENADFTRWDCAGAQVTVRGTLVKSEGGTSRIDSGVYLELLSASVQANNGTLSIASGAKLENATLNAAISGTVGLDSGLTVSGTLTGSGAGKVVLKSTLVATGTQTTLNFPAGLFEWGGSGAHIDARQSPIINVGFIHMPNTGYGYICGDVRNSGTLNIDGSLVFDLQTGYLTNLPGGVLNLHGDAADFTWSGNCYSDWPTNPNRGVVYNYGTLNKTGGGETTAVNVRVDTLGGTFHVISGTFGTGNQYHRFENASIIVDSGATFRANAAPYGDGNTTLVMSGTITGAGTGTFLFAQRIQAAGQGITLSFPAGLFEWANGGFDARHAPITNTGFIHIPNTGNGYLCGDMRNSGTINLYGSLAFDVQTANLINPPAGVINLHGDAADLGWGGNCVTNLPNNQNGGVIHNFGTLNKTGGGESTAVNVRIDTLGGTFHVISGTFGTGNHHHRFENALIIVDSGSTFRANGAPFGDFNTALVMSGTINLTGTGTFLFAQRIQAAGQGVTLNVAPGLGSWQGSHLDAVSAPITLTGRLLMPAGQSGLVCGTIYNNGVIDIHGTLYQDYRKTRFYNQANSILNFHDEADISWSTCAATITESVGAQLINYGKMNKDGPGSMSIVNNSILHIGGRFEVLEGIVGNGQYDNYSATYANATVKVAAGATLEHCSPVRVSGTLEGEGGGRFNVAGLYGSGTGGTVNFPTGMFYVRPIACTHHVAAELNGTEAPLSIAGAVQYGQSGMELYGTINGLPGAAFRGSNNGTIDVRDGATLNVAGTSSNPFLFIGDVATPTPGTWLHLVFNPGSVGNLSHCVVRDGGSNQNSVVDIFGEAQHPRSYDPRNVSPIQNNVVDIFGGTISITNCQLYGNESGVWVTGGTQPLLRNNQFEDFGVYTDNAENKLVDARFNWWGHATGPKHPTLNPNGEGVTISDHVLFDPWLRTPEARELVFTPDRGGNIGEVTLRVFRVDGSFVPNSTVKLTRSGQSDLLPIQTVFHSNLETLEATFDLSGKALGTWQLSVMSPTGQQVTTADPFTIEVGKPADVWVDLLGRENIAAGRRSTFTLLVGNRGNVDAAGALIGLSGLPTDAQIDLGSGLWQPDPADPFDSFEPTRIVSDQLISTLVITRIVGATTIARQIVITVPNPANLELRVVAIAPDGSLPLGNPLFQGQVNSTAFDGGGRYSEADVPALSEAFDTVEPLTDGDNWVYNFTNKACVGVTMERNERLHNRSLVTGSKLAGWEIAGGTAGRFLFGHTLTLLRSPHSGRVYALDTYVGGAKVIPMVEAIDGGYTYKYPASDITHAALGLPMLDYSFRLGTLQTEFETLGPKCPNPTKEKRKKTRVVASRDPNAKVGPTGSGAQNYVTSAEKFSYAIMFENQPSATAPAQEVVITDQLDIDVFDLSTFELGAISFDRHTVTPLPKSQNFSTMLDLRPEKNLLVKVQADLNLTNGLVTWSFKSIDPETGDLPEDPFNGFLVPNVIAPQGEGQVLFQINPKPGLQGRAIRNHASIVFDVNAPLITNEWFNTIDDSAPQGTMLPLQSMQPTTTFTIQWSGQDSGSGVKDYIVYVSKNNEPFQPWLYHTPHTEATFNGEPGSQYAFAVITRDVTDNLETGNLVAEATTQVLVTDPSNRANVYLPLVSR